MSYQFTATGNEDIAGDIVKETGVLREDIEQEKKDWLGKQENYTSDNSDFNTNVVAADFDEVVNRASVVTGRTDADLRKFVDGFILDESHLRVAMNIEPSVVGGVNDVELTKDLLPLGNSAADHDDPYADLGADDKLKLLWHFVNRTITEGQSHTTKVAGKFDLSDDDLDELVSLGNEYRGQLAVLAYRMKITSLTDVTHMWALKIDKVLDKAIEKLTVGLPSLEEVTGEDLEMMSKMSASLQDFDLEEKLRHLNGAMANMESETLFVRRAAFKVISDFEVFDDDIEYVVNNIQQIVSADGSAVEVPYDIFSSSFSKGDLLAIPGGIASLVWECVSIDELTSAVIPGSERRRIVDELLYLLSVINSESNLLPMPEQGLAGSLNKADQKRELNNAESLFSQIARLKDEYENPDAEDEDGETEFTEEEIAAIFGNDEAYEESEDDYSVSDEHVDTPGAEDVDMGTISSEKEDEDEDNYGWFGNALGQKYSSPGEKPEESKEDDAP